jgi:hypothetical protein
VVNEARQQLDVEVRKKHASRAKLVLPLGQGEHLNMENFSVFDALMLVWEGRKRPGFLPFIWQPDINVFWGFVLGLEAAAIRLEKPYTEFIGFRDWLRDVKREFPAEGWHEQFLREANGDHLAGILRYLERVIEYRTYVRGEVRSQ